MHSEIYKKQKNAWLGKVMWMDEKRKHQNEYWSGNRQAEESEEDQGKDGLRTLKKIYRGWE